MSYRDFLSCRSVMMAFAILWIMLYHTHIVSGVPAIDTIIGIGYAGSDVFYFLSGIGLYFSLSKSHSIMDYYKKRFLRVMPMYWCFIGFWIAFRMIWDELPWTAAIANIFAVESFIDIDRAFNWYISFLLVFYLIAPALKRFMEYLPKAAGLLIICAVSFVLGYCIVDNSNIMIGLARLPIFSLGMYVGSTMSTDPDGRLPVPELIAWLLLIPVGIAGVIYFGRDFMVGWHTGMLWYPLVLSVPGLCMAIWLIFRLLPDAAAVPFDFIGRHTLSIYLVHIFIYDVYEIYFLGIRGIDSVWWHWIVIWVLVALFCYLLEKLTSAVMHIFTNHASVNA